MGRRRTRTRARKLFISELTRLFQSTFYFLSGSLTLQLMNMLGNIPPPNPQTALQAPQILEVEFIGLCQALRTCVNSIVQTSPLQQSFCDKQVNPDYIPNSGRIILFSSSNLRNFEQLQEFLNKTIEECNKTVEQIQKSEKLYAV